MLLARSLPCWVAAAHAQLAIVQVEQKQKDRVYELPLRVVVGWGEGEQRSTAEQHQTTDERKVRFTFPSPTPPTWFRFDPREEVLLKQVEVHKPRALWIAQLERDDTWGRLRAARALKDDRHGESTRALAAALAGDPFWGVREACAEALGSRPAGREPLRAALTAQASPFVRRACAMPFNLFGCHPVRSAALQNNSSKASFAIP